MKLKNKLKTQQKLAAALLTIIIALPSNTAKANECGEVVKACDAAIAAQKKEIDLRIRESNVQKDILAAQDTRIIQLEKDKTGLFNSPWFYFGLGIVTSALLIKGQK